MAIPGFPFGLPALNRWPKNMKPDEFAACVAKEKDSLIATFSDPESGSSVAARINAMGLTKEQKNAIASVLDCALTDAFYTLLLGLDGAASLGGQQQDYELRDEDGTLLTGGELEGAAWEAFHGDGTQ